MTQLPVQHIDIIGIGSEAQPNVVPSDVEIQFTFIIN
jgi:hypothetical protein